MADPATEINSAKTDLTSAAALLPKRRVLNYLASAQTHLNAALVGFALDDDEPGGAVDPATEINLAKVDITAASAMAGRNVQLLNYLNSALAHLVVALDGLTATAAYPGQPPAGKLFWGATIQGNNFDSARLVAHEAACACVMGLHRSFFLWTHRTTYMIDQATGDIAAGRVPWVSIKTPPWPEVAAGTHDALIDAMLTALDGCGGPVWLTVHHEPEGGGSGGNVPDDPSGPVGWLAMQTKIRARMFALGVTNIAFGPVLMSYTWNTASGRNPEQWWAPGLFDFLGIDHYTWTETTLLEAIWTKVKAFAAAKGVDIAVGEWGMRGTNAAAGQRVHDWYDAAAASTTPRVVALAAFDYNIGVGSDDWTLYGEQLTAFRALLDDPRTYLVP